MNTREAAQQSIAAAESAPIATPSTPASSNAHEYVDAAGQEFDYYVAADPQSLTRRAAAAAMTTLDPRPMVSTRDGLIRRQHNDGDQVHGSAATRRTARQMIDMFAAFEGEKADPRDKAAMQAHDFASEVNASTMEPTLPIGGSFAAPGSDEWREAGEAVIDRIIERGKQK